MGIQYTNRHGDVYYLQQCPGKCDKPGHTLMHKRMTEEKLDLAKRRYRA